MTEEYCIHNMPIYKLDDGKVFYSCAECNPTSKKKMKLEKKKEGQSYAEFRRVKYKFPEMTDAYLRILDSIINNGEIVVSIPHDQAKRRFKHRYKEIKGYECDDQSKSYQPYINRGVRSYSYKLMVRLDLNGIDHNDFDFTESIEFVRGKNRITIMDNSWIHGLFKMGFDLGIIHDMKSIEEWINEERESMVVYR